MTAAQDWVEIAKRVGSRVAIARTKPHRAEEAWPETLSPTPPAAEGDQIYQHVILLGRTSYGVELAFERLAVARSDYDSAADEGVPARVAETAFRMSSELHALFVFADAFWDNLKPLADALPGLPEIARAWQGATADIRSARTARDHVEHVAERIVEGRQKRRPTMAAETFRRSSGGFDGYTAYFGDEEFNVVEIRNAVAAAELSVRRTLLRTF